MMDRATHQKVETMTDFDFSDIEPDELAVRKAAARTAVEASKFTGDILPRLAYILAGAPVPEDATDELQPNPGGPGAPR